MTDDSTTNAAPEPDLLYVPPKVWAPMDLSTLRPGGFRRALNGAGMLWLSGVWIALIIVAIVRPAPPAPQIPLAMVALCVPLTLWQWFGLWRICSLPTPGDTRKREFSTKTAIQCLLFGIGLPIALFGAIAILVLLVARP